MLRILWLAPNFNHYKARFLEHLAKDITVSLTILSGTGREYMGDKELEDNWHFKHIKAKVSKKDFGKSKIVKNMLASVYGSFDWILIPAEKKNLSLFLFALKLKKVNSGVRLFSYNHAQLKSKNQLLGFLDNRLTKFFNRKLDRVIFYTEDACKIAIKRKLIDKEKAFWANNTIDNTEIEKHYSFQLPPKQLTILFIGRLIPTKRIDEIIRYYKALKSNFSNIKLEIIGDGPENNIVEEAIKNDASIIWYGTLVDEAKIAPIMRRTSIVFIPGLSGLSINHAFTYGKPYITINADKHGPEISYLEDGKNGYILNDNFEENIEKISDLLNDNNKLQEFCVSANEKGKELSVQKWVEQLKSSLLHE